MPDSRRLAEKCLKIDKIVLYYEYYRVIGDAPQSQRHPFYLDVQTNSNSARG